MFEMDNLNIKFTIIQIVKSLINKRVNKIQFNMRHFIGNT